MARRKNRKTLKHWAFIHSVENYARGVVRSAETSFAYFGHTLSPSARQVVMSELMGSDKNSVAKGNTLQHKQSRLLLNCKALVVCYDNYQRGIKLQHQRWTHSSSYFIGTHQCGHKVTVFKDPMFDAIVLSTSHIYTTEFFKVD